MAVNGKTPGDLLSNKISYIKNNCPEKFVTWVQEELRPAIRRMANRLKSLETTNQNAESYKKEAYKLKFENKKLKNELAEAIRPEVKRAANLRHSKAEFKHEQDKLKEIYGK